MPSPRLLHPYVLESTLAFLVVALLLAVTFVNPQASNEPSPPFANASCTDMIVVDSPRKQLAHVGGAVYQDPWSLLGHDPLMAYSPICTL